MEAFWRILTDLFNEIAFLLGPGFFGFDTFYLGIALFFVVVTLIFDAHWVEKWRPKNFWITVPCAVIAAWTTVLAIHGSENVAFLVSLIVLAIWLVKLLGALKKRIIWKIVVILVTVFIVIVIVNMTKDQPESNFVATMINEGVNILGNFLESLANR
ncbi:MAG: hypothetical protein JWN28_638 [Candidatus Saccharibacteria bacterium]|nr:hypothetical protein [Candidatus Saccharibacteria bacterium]